MARITIVTPHPAAAANGWSLGGVDRSTVLLWRMLQRHNYEVSITGPRGIWEYTPSPLAALQPWIAGSDNEPDLVIANSPFGLTVPRSVPVIWLAHGAFAASARIAEATLKERVWRRFAAIIEAQSCRRARKVVAVSEFVKRMLARYYGRYDSIVLHNAIDTDFWSRPETPIESDKPMCLFVGPPSRSKGFNLFLTLAERLSDRAHFVCALSSKWEKTGWRDVEVHTALDEERLKELYCRADLLVFPSHFEGCPYVLLESWSCSVPTLTSPIGHVPELVEHHTWLRDFVVPSFDESTWLHAAEHALDQVRRSSVRRELGMKFRSIALEHHALASWEKQWIQIIQQFQS